MNLRKICLGIAGLLVAGTAIAQDQTKILELSNAKVDGGVVLNQTVGGRAGVATLDPFFDDAGYANIWGTAADSIGGFGMRPSGNSGYGGWASSGGALLSDVKGVSFDWYNATDGLGDGFQLGMYVYGPASEDQSGFLLFDLSSLLSSQPSARWNSAGNLLTNSAMNSARYYADLGSEQYSGYQNWGSIQTTLAGWSVYDIGIMNESGLVISVDQISVTSPGTVPPGTVPEGGSTMVLLGAVLAGLGVARRKMVA